MNSLKDKIREIEKEEIIMSLKKCGWVMARAARELGITERMIGYKIAKYKIRKEGDSICETCGLKKEMSEKNSE